MDLLLISDENNCHYVYINDFDKFICNKTKNRNKIEIEIEKKNRNFCKWCLQFFSSEKVLIERKENC